jgi:squalene synthase HpnC
MPNAALLRELARHGPDAGARRRWTLGEARGYCRELADRHYENFVVGSLLLPAGLRPHWMAVYAWCRWADDLADEIGDRAESERLLEWWDRELTAAYAGAARHPVAVALAATNARFQIPEQPYRDLLSAFRQDQRVARYSTAEDVLDYCRRSANPVGRIVLHLAECHNETAGPLSDAICTGLQLANFCQDLARDYRDGRIYLPEETLAACGATFEDFQSGAATAPLRAALAIEVDRAEGYFAAGESLRDHVVAWLRPEVSLIVAGGRAILEAIRACGYDVWTSRPKVSKWKQLQLLGSLLLGA